MADELDKLYPGIEKQVTFATAVTLTALAKKGQKTSIADIEDTFTVRGNWAQPSNKFGVKISPATKGKLESTVGTAADWLVPHETGATKTAEGGDIAIPTKEIRPNIANKISRAKRPKSLTKAFVTTFKSGHRAIVERVTKARLPLRILYHLVSSARIKKNPTVVEPTLEVVEKELGKTFADAIRKAFSTQK